MGYTETAQAKPDGYTLVSAITPLTIVPHQVATAFTYKSFEPVINMVSVGSVKGVAAPKGTPPEVIAYLADRFKKVCDDLEFIKSMKDIGQPVMYLGPDDFGKYMKEGYEQFGKLIREFNIKLE